LNQKQSGATGIGSASLVLMFTVLSLAILAIISYTAANREKALADAEAALVTGYYEADLAAEQVVAEILAGDAIPETALGVAITQGWDDGYQADTAEFVCPISDKKELHVKIAVGDESGAYNVITWQMRDTVMWQPDDSELPVWLG
jgi:hypothetical protein